MKILSRIAIGAALVMLVAAAQPAQAACGADYLVDATTAAGETSFVRTNPDWCAGFACYYMESMSQQYEAFFWGLGTGNPAIGQGDDNGAFAAQGNWLFLYTTFLPDTSPYYGALGRFAGANGAGNLTWA